MAFSGAITALLVASIVILQKQNQQQWDEIEENLRLTVIEQENYIASLTEVTYLCIL